MACLFFLGERLGWSLKQAGAVGLLLCTNVCLAGAVADWRAEPVRSEYRAMAFQDDALTSARRRCRKRRTAGSLSRPIARS